jgi:membrane peptidoglycan carboxypeptidase
MSEPIEVSVNPFSPDYTPIESIAKTVNLALVTSEDNAFFNHKGIDLFALENAIHRNFKEKRIAVGGSTITMQTVKNLYLGHERTISRKIQEFFLAWHLEKILDKNRILEIYMNIVEFGPGVYGITNASQHFFGKHPFDLNLVESAYLASVLPSPKGRYQNFCNGKLSAGFKDLVYGLLKRMLHLNRIPYERYASAMGVQLEFNSRARTTTEGCQSIESDE